MDTFGASNAPQKRTILGEHEGLSRRVHKIHASGTQNTPQKGGPKSASTPILPRDLGRRARSAFPQKRVFWSVFWRHKTQKGHRSAFFAYSASAQEGKTGERARKRKNTQKACFGALKRACARTKLGLLTFWKRVPSATPHKTHQKHPKKGQKRAKEHVLPPPPKAGARAGEKPI